jgi:DNA replication protein DnaC
LEKLERNPVSKLFLFPDKSIIDDWLRDPLSSSEARDLLDLLDERYRTASCLFATQLPIQQWHQHIHDPTLADAMLDRVVHDALRIVLKGAPDPTLNVV